MLVALVLGLNLSAILYRSGPETSAVITASAAKAEKPRFIMNEAVKISTQHLNFYYGDFLALNDICLEIPENQVTALIGPSGCRKAPT